LTEYKIVYYNVYMNSNNTENKKILRASLAYEMLKTAIEKRQFQPGQQLVEVELCEWLDMSRTPIREALSRLRAEGLVEYYPARGYVVSTFSYEKFKQIYEAIEALEGMLAYLLAIDHSNPEFDGVREAVIAMERAAIEKNWDAWLVADTKYHTQMYNCCSNEYILRELEILSKPSQQVRIMITRTYIDKEQSTKEHRAVYDAIVEGDREKARTLAQKHYNRVRRDVLEFLRTYNI